MNDNDLSMKVFWARAFRASPPQSLSDALGVLAGLIDDPAPFQSCADAIRAHHLAMRAAPLRGQAILNEVAAKHGISVGEIKSQSRRQKYSRPRQEAYFRLRTETSLSYPNIGKMIGGRDHTTVMYGVDQHMKTEGIDREEFGDRVSSLRKYPDRSIRQQAKPEPCETTPPL